MKNKWIFSILSLLLASTVLMSCVHAAESTKTITRSTNFYAELSKLSNKQDDSYYFQYMDMTVGKTGIKMDGVDIKTDAAPEVCDGILYLPLRPIVEAVGGMARFNSQTRSAIIIDRYGEELCCPIGRTLVSVNGVLTMTDSISYIKNGRTYLSAQAFSPALGLETTWDEKTGEITLSAPYQSARLLVTAKKLDVSQINANTILYDGNDMWALQFDMPSQAQNAAAKLAAQGVTVEPDRIVTANVQTSQPVS